MEIEEFLCPFPSFEAELAPFLLPCRSMRLFDQVVAAGCRYDLHVLHMVEHREFSDGCPVAPEVVSVDDLRDRIFAKETYEKGLGSLGIAVFLEENVQHVPVFIDGPPQPVLDPTDLDAYLVQMPPRAPVGFSVAQCFSQERRKFDVPLSRVS